MRRGLIGCAILPIVLHAGTCPGLLPSDDGPTVDPPQQRVQDPVAWMRAAAQAECDADASDALQVLRIKAPAGQALLVANPCRSGTNTVYEVFMSDRNTQAYCVTGELGGSRLQPLHPGPQGHPRGEVRWHLSATEFQTTVYELQQRRVLHVDVRTNTAYQ